jgi:putative oxidoreductase
MTSSGTTNVVAVAHNASFGEVMTVPRLNSHQRGRISKMSLARFVLQGTVGGLMTGHGLQKLNGSFGGSGLEATEKGFAALGLYPAKWQAKAAALSETIGGGLTAVGLLSPLGPAMITGTMAVAIAKVHAKNGVWVTKGGFEYNATLMAAAFLLASEGPGAISIDGLLQRSRSGLQWGALSLALGLGGAAATLAIAHKFTPASGETASPASDAVDDASA